MSQSRVARDVATVVDDNGWSKTWTRRQEVRCRWLRRLPKPRLRYDDGREAVQEELTQPDEPHESLECWSSVDT